ncbi:hypothetical protein ACFODL_06990 [Phenylobacterium terrae]|uniref:Uncharacterized protein n=1 Tax=Phenylobacterium terrae TaxID=2665495 RepID=A0ABW4N6Q1_9CAUL
MATRAVALLLGLLLGLQAATAWVAWTFQHAPALGAGVTLLGVRAHAPWSVLIWRARYGHEEPRVFASALWLVLLGPARGSGPACSPPPGGPAGCAAGAAGPTPAERGCWRGAAACSASSMAGFSSPTTFGRPW